MPVTQPATSAAIKRIAVVEDALIGEKLSQEILAAVAGRTRQIVAPINDVRATADYRRTVSGNLLLRLLDARPQI